MSDARERRSLFLSAKLRCTQAEIVMERAREEAERAVLAYEKAWGNYVEANGRQNQALRELLTEPGQKMTP